MLCAIDSLRVHVHHRLGRKVSSRTEETDCEPTNPQPVRDTLGIVLT